jgi:hypothetical protein
LPFGDADVLAAAAADGTARRAQFSVMLLDCSRLSWDITKIVSDLDCGALDYHAHMHDLSIASCVRAEIPARWNCLEAFDADTALLHYTDMPTQPWLSTVNPLGYLWTRALINAITTGFLTRAEVVREIAAGHVRPSLLYQIDHAVEDSLLLPRHAVDQDRAFAPPWTALRRRARGLYRGLRAGAALAARLAAVTGAGRWHRRIRARVSR